MYIVAAPVLVVIVTVSFNITSLALIGFMVNFEQCGEERERVCVCVYVCDFVATCCGNSLRTRKIFYSVYMMCVCVT
jgi:hypothetical protein